SPIRACSRASPISGSTFRRVSSRPRRRSARIKRPRSENGGRSSRRRESGPSESGPQPKTCRYLYVAFWHEAADPEDGRIVNGATQESLRAPGPGSLRRGEELLRSPL